MVAAEARADAEGREFNDFSAYFVRHYWGDQFPDVTADVRALRMSELILSGALDQMAQRLCHRVGARCAAGAVEVDSGLVAEEEASFRERTGRSDEDTTTWLDRIGRAREWFREMLRMEVIHRRDRQSASRSRRGNARSLRCVCR